MASMPAASETRTQAVREVLRAPGWWTSPDDRHRRQRASPCPPLVPPYGAVLRPCRCPCHGRQNAAPPEMFTGGAQLLRRARAPPASSRRPRRRDARQLSAAASTTRKPSAPSIAQATELGTRLHRVTRPRLARAVPGEGPEGAHGRRPLRQRPAAPWLRAGGPHLAGGVDALSFGCTKKNKYIKFLQKRLAERLTYRRMRGGQLGRGALSRCPDLAYLEGDLWLNNARHANSHGQAARRGAGARCRHPPGGGGGGQRGVRHHARRRFQALTAEAHCHEWPGMGSGFDKPGADEASGTTRISFRTTEEDVGNLPEARHRHAPVVGRAVAIHRAAARCRLIKKVQVRIRPSMSGCFLANPDDLPVGLGGFIASGGSRLRAT